MSNLKSDRRRVTLYLDRKHSDWFDNQPVNSKSDLVNCLIDEYRQNVDGVQDRIKTKAFESTTTKVLGPLTERFFIRFPDHQITCINKVCATLGKNHIDYIREIVWKSTLSAMKKYGITN